MDGGKKSGSQKLFTGLVSPSTAAKMEAESRTWMVRCPKCGFEQSVWETGGVQYKAAGNSYWFRRCPNCHKRSWQKVYRKEGAAAEVAAAVPATSLPQTSPRSRWLLWALLLGGIVVAVVAFIAILFFIINLFTQPVATAGDDFMTALKTGDFSHAYALTTPDLQKEIGTVAGMAVLVQDHRPAQWNWTSRSLRNGVGRLEGPFTYSDGKPGTAHLTLQQVGSDWKIASFQFNPG